MNPDETRTFNTYYKNAINVCEAVSSLENPPIALLTAARQLLEDMYEVSEERK